MQTSSNRLIDFLRHPRSRARAALRTIAARRSTARQRTRESYVRDLCRREFESQTYAPNERVIEYRFVFESVHRTSPVSVLDVGTGLTALPHLLRNCGFLVTAIDNTREYWGGALFNRHYHVIDDDILHVRTTAKFDFVTSVSTLEHIREHAAAVRSMFGLLNPGGHVALTFPYNENRYVPNVYALEGAGFGAGVPYICQVYSRAELSAWRDENGADIVAQEYWQCYEGALWTFGADIFPPRQVNRDVPHQLTCVLMRKRASSQ